MIEQEVGGYRIEGAAEQAAEQLKGRGAEDVSIEIREGSAFVRFRYPEGKALWVG